MLSWEELQAMASEGAAFGSHTHTHCNMAVESNERQREELNTSKQSSGKPLELAGSIIRLSIR